MIRKVNIKKNIVYSAIINLCVLILLNLISYPQYELDTDVMMQSIIYNIQRVDLNEQIIFSNVFIGKLLNLMIELESALPWYMILNVGFVILSLFTIGVIFLKDNETVLGKIVYIVFCLFCGYECYIKLSYIKTATIMCVSAFYLLFYLLEKGKKKFWIYFSIMFLFIFSSMISWNMFKISGTICGIFCFVYFCINDPSKLKNITAILILFIGLFICYSIRIYDNSYYLDKNEWSTALEYRESIEKVAAFGAPEFSEEIGEELNIDYQLYNCLIKGNYISSGNRGLELISKIANLRKDITGYNLLRFFRTVPIRFLENSMFYCFMILGCACCFSAKKNKKIMFIINMSVVLCAYFISYIFNAWNNEIVNVIIFLPACVFVFMNCKKMHTENTNSIIIYLMILGLVLYENFSYKIVTTVEKEEMQIYLDKQERNDGLYAVDLNELLKQYSAYVVYPTGLLERKNLRIINGNYSIIPGYEQLTNISYNEILNGVKWNNWMDLNEIFVE